MHHQFILDPAKKGSQSAAQLIDDLSDVVDQYADIKADISYVVNQCLQERNIKARGESLDVMVDDVQNLSLDQPFVNAQDTPSTPRSFACPTADPSSPPDRPLSKRFTLLIDPSQMLDKNYATRKEKARAFLAALFDAGNVEMVHIGLGRKSVEEQIIGACVPSPIPYLPPQLITTICSG